PVVEHTRRDRRARPLRVLLDQGAQDRDVAVLERVEADELHVAAALAAAVLVEAVRDAAAHPGGEVAPGAAEHDDAAAGHVLAAVVADALDDCVRARVAHAEALARKSAEERAALGGAVE